MKPQQTLTILSTITLFIVATSPDALAQQYKLRQATSVSGMKSESTIYVKGMRKRTEGGGYAGMTNPTTIEQCDLQRTIKINDKKKLYFIEPFSKETEEIIDENVKPVAVKSKPVAVTTDPSKAKTGGVINMWYNIVDTGERKKMYGFNARHIWTTQKIKPSADACMMKDSMIIKTDGWYIDLPQFNCPIQYNPAQMKRPAGVNQPECKDRYVSRRSGKGKLGFPLTETKTMIMGNGSMQTSQFETNLETLEFSTAKLDSMLFEIPVGYQETKNEEDLQEKFDVSSMIDQQRNAQANRELVTVNPGDPKKKGVTRIGVYVPKTDEQLEAISLQQHIVSVLMTANSEAIAVTSREEAQKYNCDLLLTTEFLKLKQGSKVGGFIKAVKNADPAAASSYNIEAEMTLANLADGSIRSQEKVNGKYEGKAQDAAMKALDKGCNSILSGLR